MEVGPSLERFALPAELREDIPPAAHRGPAQAIDALVHGLTSLGLGRRGARERLDAALGRLGPDATDEAGVLREALRMGA